MHKKTIKVKMVAQTAVDVDAVTDVIRELGFDTDKVFIPNSETDGFTPASALIWYAAKRCYQAFGDGVNKNITKVRDDMAVYFENILRSGHGSVFEHASMSFSIEGVSRVFTGEMNRHRAGVAISEGSMRYIRLDDLGYWEPHSITEGQGGQLKEKMLGAGYTADAFDMMQGQTRKIFEDAFIEMENTQNKLNAIWDIDGDRLKTPGGFAAKKLLTSMFRRLVGMGVATGGTWTLNYRAVRHILQLRGSLHAEEEIYHVVEQMYHIVKEKEPLLFADFEEIEGKGLVPLYAKV